MVGTIAGAAVLSVVSAIAGTLYTSSMARARDVVVLVRSRRGVAEEPPATVLVPRVGRASLQGWTRPDRARARRALATTAAVFALAAAFLAGLQLATGAPVTGTNLGSRTAAGAVVDEDSAGGSARSDTTDRRAQGSANSSDSPTGTATGATGTATGTATAGATDNGTDSSAGADTAVTGTPTAPAGGPTPADPTAAAQAQQTPAGTTPAAGSGANAPAATTAPAGATAPAG
ncbi:hypothetical protein GCM10028802_31740 [Terrabacter terrigena]